MGFKAEPRLLTRLLGKLAKSSTTDRDLLKSNYDLKLEALLEERKAREKS
jgi:hypothetical protein